MDDSINNIYFLKETISKFKNEIQKFISDPSYSNHNAVNLRHSIEDLEKTIIDKEKNLAGQILNNNQNTFNPITTKYSNSNYVSNYSNNFQKNSLTENGKGFFSQSNKNKNNISVKSENLGLSSGKFKTNYNSIQNFNKNNLNNNLNNNLSNNPNLNVILNNINNNQTFAYNNSNRNALQTIHPYGDTAIYYETNLNSVITSPNNRNDIPIDIKGISENYYDLKYITKQKALMMEYSPRNQMDSKAVYFNNKITGRLSEEKEKRFFKNNLILRRVNDEIHDKISNLDNFNKNKLETEKIINKYDISRKKLNKINLKRSAGNINFMDKKKIQKFAHDKKNLFVSVNYDKNNLPIITQEELNRGMLSMINRGIIPKQADLTPAFQREGHPMSLAAGQEVKEIYAKSKPRDEIEHENYLGKIKYELGGGPAFFLTAGIYGNVPENNLNNENFNQDNETKNAVKTIPKLIFGNDNEKVTGNWNDNGINGNNIKDLLKSQNFKCENKENVNNNYCVVDTNLSQELELNKIIKENIKDIYRDTENSPYKTGRTYDEEYNLIQPKNREMKLNDDVSSYNFKSENILHKRIKFQETENNFNDNPENNLKKIDNRILDNQRYNNEYTNNSEKENVFYDDSEKASEKILTQSIYYKNQQNKQSEKNRTEKEIFLLCINFKFVQNEEFIKLKKSNEEIWGKINYLLEHIQKLFKKLNFPYEEINCIKLVSLASDELRNISNKDLILLMTNRHLQKRGFLNPKTLHLNLKEAFVLRIQKFYRMYKAKKNFLLEKNKLKKIKKIQRKFRLTKINRLAKLIIEEKRDEKFSIWKKMMFQFRKNWSFIKTSSRVEIHINSYSFSNYKNCTMEKFLEKQNNQLNRIINLRDPNVEMIYISPFNLDNQVLSYYFSILSTLGVENAKERFHLVIPVK